MNLSAENLRKSPGNEMRPKEAEEFETTLISSTVDDGPWRIAGRGRSDLTERNPIELVTWAGGRSQSGLRECRIEIDSRRSGLPRANCAEGAPGEAGKGQEKGERKERKTRRYSLKLALRFDDPTCLDALE
ncbi:hypothetical protein KM043_012237 [Ampulex compressa]|nr:hypothetical protein KM043_012237 [Ampulex compressa]